MDVRRRKSNRGGMPTQLLGQRRAIQQRG
jgi:hypothetical protein